MTTLKTEYSETIKTVTDMLVEAREKLLEANAMLVGCPVEIQNSWRIELMKSFRKLDKFVGKTGAFRRDLNYMGLERAIEEARHRGELPKEEK